MAGRAQRLRLSALALVLALGCTASPPKQQGQDEPEPLPILVELPVADVGDEVPQGDYVWLGEDEAFIAHQGGVGPARRGTRRALDIVGPGDLRGETSFIGRELVRLSEGRGIHRTELDPTPVVFVADGRVNAAVLWHLQQHATQSRRMNQFLVVSTQRGPRAVALAPPFDGVFVHDRSEPTSEGFELGLVFALDREYIRVAARAHRTGGHRAGYGKIVTRPDRIPIDLDGQGHCEMPTPPDREELRRISRILCGDNEAKRLDVTVELHAESTIADVLAVLIALPQVQECQAFETVAWRPDQRPGLIRQPIPTCENSVDVTELRSAFEAAKAVIPTDCLWRHSAGECASAYGARDRLPGVLGQLTSGAR